VGKNRTSTKCIVPNIKQIANAKKGKNRKMAAKIFKLLSYQDKKNKNIVAIPMDM